MNAAKSRFLPKVDNRSKFRSFIIAYHKKYGYLLLRSYKPQKGLHFQLPGLYQTTTSYIHTHKINPREYKP